MDWPQYIPERKLSACDRELREVNKQLINLRRELNNIITYNRRISLAQFFSEYNETKPPKITPKSNTGFGGATSFNGLFSDASIIVEMTTKHMAGMYPRKPKSIELVVKIDRVVAISSSGSFTDEHRAKIYHQGRTADVDVALKIIQKELYPAIWKRLVRKYTREHQARWPEVQHRQ